MKSIIVLFLFCIVIWSGCNKEGNNANQANTDNENVNGKNIDTTAQIFEGIYFSGPQLRKLHLCERKEDLWVIDSTGGSLDEQYYKLKLGAHQPAFVELEGEIFPTKDSILAKRYKNTFFVYWVDLVEKFQNQIECPDYKLIFRGQGKNRPGKSLSVKMKLFFCLATVKTKQFILIMIRL